MTLGRLLLLGGVAMGMAMSAGAAMAEPWRGEGGYRRYERQHDRRWSERDRWERDRRGGYDRRRADYERSRAYEQGRRDSRRTPDTRDPVAALGLRGR
jgi:hypothetical protein